MKAEGPRRSWQTLWLSLVLFLFVSLLSAIPVIRDWQARLSDTMFRLAPPPQQRSRVVLVMIDDQTLQQYGRWPWSRTVLARLTDNLAQAGAGPIGLDILLAETQSPEADKALEQSLQAAGRVVIVDKIGTYSDGSHWIEPLPAFARASAAVGHAQAVLDFDSVCRRFPALELTLDGPRWGFAVEVARRTDAPRTAAFLAAYGIPFTDEPGAISTAQPRLIRIAFRRDGFDTIPASEVLSGVDPGRVRDRPVLVGFGPTEIIDRLSTPLNTEFPTPGITVHAQILDSILTGRRLYDLPFWPSVALLLVTCGLAVMVFRRWRGLASVGLFVLLGGLVYACALLVFWGASRVVPAGSMMLAVVLAPALVYGADFVAVERSVTQQLLGLRSWLALRGRDVRAPERANLSWRLDLLQDLQTELGSLYELHKTLLESTQDLIAIFDERGSLILSNRAFASACGPGVENGFTLKQLRALWGPKEDAPLVAKGPVEEGEVYLGIELYAARIAPLPPTRLSPGGGKIVTLASLHTRVERDSARAEALSFITHELRTPLSSIQGFAELMVRYPGSPSIESAPETIYRESKRLLALISSYLDVLRLDAGAKPMSSHIIDLEDVIRQVFDILQPLATPAGMRLVREDRHGVCILGDAPLISGAILNLVSNAIKYGRPGTDIRVSYARDHDDVVISVQNQGQPIAQQDIPRLFDPYYRASNVPSGKTGWGLGLAFVKRIAEKHGGSVRVESKSQGTIFEIRLPGETEDVSAAKETP
jgi:signal transduction histidine kinase